MEEKTDKHEYNIRKLNKILNANDVSATLGNTHTYRKFHTLNVKDPDKIQKALALATENGFEVQNLTGTVLRLNNEKILPKKPVGDKPAAKEKTLATKNVATKTAAKKKDPPKPLDGLREILKKAEIKVSTVTPIKKGKIYSLTLLDKTTVAKAIEVAKAEGYGPVQTGTLTFQIPGDGTLKKKRKKRKSKKGAVQPAAAVVAKPATTKNRDYEIAVLLMKDMNSKEATEFVMRLAQNAGLTVMNDADKKLLANAKKAKELLG